MSNNHRIDYLEFGCADIPTAKKFYGSVFGWEFTDYGPEYTAFKDGRLDGGFTTHSKHNPGGALVVLYADNLEATRDAVLSAGGTIEKPIFSFPGGRRFHFNDPNGMEMAVWSE